MEEDTNEEVASEQPKNSRNPAEHLKAWQYKKGESGNWSGRPEGRGFKDYHSRKFRKMTDEELEEYSNGMNKKDVVEFAEGKPDTKTDITSGGEKLQPLLVKFITGDEPNNGDSNRIQEAV